VTPVGSLHDRIISYFVGSFYVEKHLKHVGAAMKAFLFGGTVENGKRKVCLLSFLKQLRRLTHEKKTKGKKKHNSYGCPRENSHWHRVARLMLSCRM